MSRKRERKVRIWHLDRKRYVEPVIAAVQRGLTRALGSQ